MTDASGLIVTDFLQSLPHGTECLDRYLSEDVEYWNVPLEPLHGRAAAKAFLAPFVNAPPGALKRMQILHSAYSSNCVFNERIETWSAGDVSVDLPVMGIFELRDKHIVSWRDYFDLATIKPVLDAITSR